MGLFQDIHKNHLAPLMLSTSNGAGEAITVYGDPSNFDLTAIVILSEMFSGTQQGQRQTLQGTVELTEADAEKAAVTVLSRMSLRGADFAVRSVGLPVGGMVKIEVQQVKREHSNTSALDPI